MDTYITVTAYGETSDEAVKAAENKITALEKLWSVTDQNSEVYTANHNGSAVLSAETAELVRFALVMCRETDGTLDMTLYPVLTAWGFTTDEHHVPTDAELTALLDHGGNIQTIGAKPDGTAWKIGVRSPYGDGSFATLAVKDKASMDFTEEMT